MAAVGARFTAAAPPPAPRAWVGATAAVCGGASESVPMMYTGQGRGDYVAETSYRYVGTGAGEFNVVPKASVSQQLWRIVAIGGGICGLLAVVVLVAVLRWPRAGMTSTTPQPYDCMAGWSDWESHWTPGKKLWCCDKIGKGCPSTPRPPAPQTARAAQAPLPRSRPPEANPSPRFNCSAGFANWEAGWSVPKKVFCCQDVGKGCPTRAPARAGSAEAPYDCDAGFANRAHGWSSAKRAWCCQHAGKGCPPSTPLPAGRPYDCDAGWADWVVAWSIGKKVWCCHHAGKGCSETR